MGGCFFFLLHHAWCLGVGGGGTTGSCCPVAPLPRGIMHASAPASGLWPFAALCLLLLLRSLLEAGTLTRRWPCPLLRTVVGNWLPPRRSEAPSMPRYVMLNQGVLPIHGPRISLQTPVRPTRTRMCSPVLDPCEPSREHITPQLWDPLATHPRNPTPSPSHHVTLRNLRCC